MARKLKSFKDDLKEWLKDPKQAEAYLKVALEEYEEDGDLHMFLKALKNIALAQGGIAELAERVDMKRQSLYQALSDKGNPRTDSLFSILHGLGYKFSVERISASG